MYRILSCFLLFTSTILLASSDTDLKITKLFGIVEELELRIKKQEEKIAILEKGLMLGLIPEELKEYRMSPEVDSLSVPKPKPSQPKAAVSQGSFEEYQALIKEAQMHFSQRNYGQAIDLYEKIEKHHVAQNREGQASFWMGLSWYYLKEFELSEKNFSALISRYKQSPWLPKAKFYQAKIMSERGRNQEALEAYYSLQELFPDSEIAEMATLEIQNIRGNLK